MQHCSKSCFTRGTLSTKKWSKGGAVARAENYADWNLRGKCYLRHAFQLLEIAARVALTTTRIWGKIKSSRV
jgi:hypothetical protein